MSSISLLLYTYCEILDSHWIIFTYIPHEKPREEKGIGTRQFQTVLTALVHSLKLFIIYVNYIIFIASSLVTDSICISCVCFSQISARGDHMTTKEINIINQTGLELVMLRKEPHTTRSSHINIKHLTIAKRQAHLQRNCSDFLC